MSLADARWWMREISGRGRAERLAAAQRDPWLRFDLEPPLRAFGPGANVEFSHYLGGVSRVTARTPVEIAGWLLLCRYADDPQLLDEADHWLHPTTFEVVRSGDCEDFALWAWRKMAEHTYDAEFVVGVRRLADGSTGRHAWVTYRHEREEFLFDGVERSMDRIIRPIEEVRAHYEPQVGVSSGGRRFVFAGLYRQEWGRRLQLRRSAPSLTG